MNQLTIDQIKEKIKMVETDIDLLRRGGEGGRKLEVLCEYKEYLEEELQYIKRNT